MVVITGDTRTLDSSSSLHILYTVINVQYACVYIYIYIHRNIANIHACRHVHKTVSELGPLIQGSAAGEANVQSEFRI